MGSIKEARAANNDFKSKSLTAVFAGATSGIGLSTIEALLKSTASSKVYIVGRSESKFQATLAQLHLLDTSADLVFIEAQVSLLQEVARVCDFIARETTAIDLLWLSQGGLDASDHELTPEGLFMNYAIAYYSRILFMSSLLPLLKKSADPRVISVLSAGQEGPVDMSDPGLVNPKSYTAFWKAQKQCVTMMSLAMSSLASENRDIIFMHTMPGLVSTAVHEKWADTMTGWYAPLGWIVRWILTPLMHAVAISPETAGQMGLYEATSERYRSRDGKNFYRLLEDGEDAGDKGLAIIDQYGTDGTQAKIWAHTTEVMQRLSGQ